MNGEQTSGGSGRKPWAAYNIIERGGRRIWSRIGSAFINHDGSMNILLDSLPVGGKLQIREDDRESQRDRGGALAEQAQAEA